MPLMVRGLAGADGRTYFWILLGFEGADVRIAQSRGLRSSYKFGARVIVVAGDGAGCAVVLSRQAERGEQPGLHGAVTRLLPGGVCAR